MGSSAADEEEAAEDMEVSDADVDDDDDEEEDDEDDVELSESLSSMAASCAGAGPGSGAGAGTAAACHAAAAAVRSTSSRFCRTTFAGRVWVGDGGSAGRVVPRGLRGGFGGAGGGGGPGVAVAGGKSSANTWRPGPRSCCRRVLAYWCSCCRAVLVASGAAKAGRSARPAMRGARMRRSEPVFFRWVLGCGRSRPLVTLVSTRSICIMHWDLAHSDRRPITNFWEVGAGREDFVWDS